MNNFRELIKESQNKFSSDKLLQNEITNYINKVNKIIPTNVKDVIFLTQKYKLSDSQTLDDIKDSNKSQLKFLSSKYNIPLPEIEDLHKSLKELKNNIKLLPQYQSEQERTSLELGKISMDDLTIDLESPQGRNAATKMYMPMVYKIVNQYIGKSNLNRQELISSALLGFTYAMNNWRKDSENKDKKTTLFKTYAGYCVKHQILNDINSHGHILSGSNWYNTKTYGASLFDAINISNYTKDEGDDESKLAMLGTNDTYSESDKEKQWNELYQLIEDKFNQRNVEIFYRYFGLKGYKLEKSKDIAKSMGMSEGNIRNSIINKMISFLKSDAKATNILQDIQDMYNESLMVDLIGFTKDEILEALSNNDIFILLEELNRWNNKNVFNNSLLSVLNNFEGKDKEILDKVIHSDFEELDNHFKKNKKLIILFLSNLYPSENMNKKTDVSLIEYMEEIQNLCKKFKI